MAELIAVALIVLMVGLYLITPVAGFVALGLLVAVVMYADRKKVKQ